MASFRDGIATKSQETQQPVASKKRKAQDEPTAEENKGTDNGPPATPPPAETAESNVVAEQHERTPGRVGPILPEDFSISPDIKPFKGPPGKKVRKTWYEKDQEYKQFIRENELHPFHA
jgi:hypothetical protein